MNAESLLVHYEKIADAPDAIARLRRFILDLAVRGKLVPQDTNDEPASELQSRLNAVYISEAPEKGGRGRRSAIAAGLIEKPLFDLPPNWVWTPMGGLGETNIGLTYSPADLTQDGYPVLRSNNVQDGKIDLSALVRVRSRPKSTVMVQVGDMLICARNGSRALVGKAALLEELPEPMAFGAFMAIFRSPINGYLHLFVSSPTFRQAIDEVNTNTINQLTQGNLKSTLVSLPPLAEQHRIVAKVDELMALCDQLEAARAAREATRDRLAAASLARLNTPDVETFADDAHFALDALPALTARPDQIKQLRQTILNLAVRGKLVPQDPKDEPAEELLKRIAEERDELVKSKVIRRDGLLDPVLATEHPFAIPATWSWARIGDVVHFTQYGTSQKSHPSEKGVPVLTMGNVQDGRVVWSNEKRIPEDSSDLPDLYLRKYDLLYNRTNSAELVGKTGIYIGEDRKRTFASYLIRLRPSLRWSAPHFINLAMNTSVFRETQIVPLIKKQTGQANVNGSALKNMLVPLPPLAEQHRIIAKVDELTSLCDRLETSLTTADDTRRELLDALLAKALAPVNAEHLQAAAE
ncbi:restriction endonuclease subunit S [Rhizobium leguminosarum]|uniref:restriction endonuclease subunit S n=1 Tax=Rhizobium leguminosarum TaxID=384 RepID=UPI001F193F11|nr:restriction endonuclease subunit S [Rhizobium leguminosarum]UIK18565.1 restriction endonuclease subunit S [Rhizobium leguminosarum]